MFDDSYRFDRNFNDSQILQYLVQLNPTSRKLASSDQQEQNHLAITWDIVTLPPTSRMSVSLDSFFAIEFQSTIIYHRVSYESIKQR